MKLLLLSLFFSFNITATQPDCIQVENGTNEFIDDKLLQAINNLKQCPTDEEKISELVRNEYLKYYGAQKIVTKNVKGFNLKGHSREVDLAISMLGSKPPKAWKTAATGCDTVQCAFAKLLNSKNAAMQIFNFKAKTGYNLSLNQAINQNLGDQTWSAKEIQELDAVASKFPGELNNLKLNKIDRLADGLRAHGHNSSVAAYASNAPELVIYDTGAHGTSVGKNPYESTSWPQEVLAHEMCHHHDHKGTYATGTMTSEQHNSAFKKLSGWKEVTNKNGSVTWVHNANAQFVSGYAETQPAEDYAETCMNYLLHPQTLEKKAPAKYAYMKSKVFNGKEFKDKPWARSKVQDWPKLKEELAQESFCGQKIASCMIDLKYANGRFCDYSTEVTNGSSSIVSCGSALAQIQKNPCVLQMKKDRINEIKKNLDSEEDFCELGGAGAIDQQLNNVCTSSLNTFSQNLELAGKTNLSSFATACEAENDYSNACVIAKFNETIKLDEVYKKAVNDVVSTKVPDRMKAMASLLDKKSDDIWLKSCLKSVSNISRYESIDDKTGLKTIWYNYSAAEEKVDGGYLGKYIYDDYKRNDVNSACAKNMVTSLKEQGIKVPESGSPVNLMQKTFKDEIHSFEEEVIGKITISTKKCLVFKKCQEKAIYGLLKAWEEQSPKQRAGFATEEYAQELRQKWTFY